MSAYSEFIVALRFDQHIVEIIYGTESRLPRQVLGLVGQVRRNVEGNGIIEPASPGQIQSIVDQLCPIDRRDILEILLI
jgi:hypothetical protein